MAEKQTDLHVGEEDDDEEEEEEVAQAEEQASPEDGGQAVTPAGSSDELPFEEMWQHSLAFKLVVGGGGCLFIAALLGVFMTASRIRYESQRVDAQNEIVSKWQAIYNNCTNYTDYQVKTMARLNELIVNGTRSIADLNLQISNLTLIKSNLTEQLSNATSDLNDVKSKRIIWQIGTGVPAVLGTLGGVYAFYASGQTSQCNAAIAFTQNMSYRAIARTRQNVGLAVQEQYMLRRGYYVRRTQCYSSLSGNYTKASMMSGCQGHSGGVIIEMTTDAGIVIGAYMSYIPTTYSEYTSDSQMFVYVPMNGTFAGIKDTKYTRAFSFTTSDSTMFILGEREIVVAANTAGTTTNVTVSPGDSFDINTDTNPYGTKTSFTITSLVAYYLTQVRP